MPTAPLTTTNFPIGGLLRSALFAMKRLTTEDIMSAATTTAVSGPRDRQGRDRWTAAPRRRDFPPFRSFGILAQTVPTAWKSLHPRRIDAYIPRTATESQRGEDRDRVERSGNRDFSAQISHTQPSGSMVRVLIAPPITHRTAEISGERRQTPCIGAFRRVNLVSGFLARCL